MRLLVQLGFIRDSHLVKTKVNGEIEFDLVDIPFVSVFNMYMNFLS